MPQYIERATLHPRGFNDSAVLPYGLRVAEVKAAMDDIYDLLYNVNQFLTQRGWARLEDMLLAAAFSGVMSGLVVGGVSKQSATLTANKYHNGRPDLVPVGHYEGDSCHRGDEGDRGESLTHIFLARSQRGDRLDHDLPVLVRLQHVAY
jgi:hypothetical protein